MFGMFMQSAEPMPRSWSESLVTCRDAGRSAQIRKAVHHLALVHLPNMSDTAFWSEPESPKAASLMRLLAVSMSSSS